MSQRLQDLNWVVIIYVAAFYYFCENALFRHNALADGSKLMGKPVYNIEKDDDGNISFTFMTKEKETDAIQDIAMAEDTTGDDTVYDITGKKAGRIADIKNGSLKAGIYIIGGKRLQKKVLLK